MGNLCATGKLDRTVTLRPAENRNAAESEEYSKSLASPGNGLTSPKQRFARRTSAHKGVMSSIAMKFPHIKRSFVACKRVFEQHADPQTNTIPKSEVITVLIELGAKPESFNQGSVEDIINKANLDGDDVIDFKEFLIAAAVGCFLRADPTTTALSPCFLSIRKGFEAAKEAFGKIDKDGSGEIEFQELKEAFLAMKEDDLIMERLRELDFNGDKSIEFPEFVWGLSAWVGMDEDLDEEEDASERVVVNHVDDSTFVLDQPPSPKSNVQEEKQPQEQPPAEDEGTNLTDQAEEQAIVVAVAEIDD